MNLIGLSFSPSEDEEYSDFLNVANSSPQSLAEIFTRSVSSSPLSWNSSEEDSLVSSDDGFSENLRFTLKKEDFKKIKEGTQEENRGEIDVSLAQDYCDALNDLSEKTHVAFSADRLQNPLTGGTCSAMAFEFINDYLTNRLSSNPEKIIHEMGDKYQRSSEKFRTHQAVFNTLHRDAQYPSDDFMRDKIGAMLRFYDRTITDASERFYIEFGTKNEIEQAKETIASFLDNYPEGIFVVRSILFGTNDKGEEYGHSTVLIREPDKTFFYDPNQGIFELSNESQDVVDILKPMMQKWVVPFGRIYKVQ